MDFYSKLLERVNQAGTFSTNSRIFVTRIEQGCAEGVLHADESSLNPNGIVHGGCLVTLADTVAGCAAHGLGGQYVTLSSNLNFLAPALLHRLNGQVAALFQSGLASLQKEQIVQPQQGGRQDQHRGAQVGGG